MLYKKFEVSGDLALPTNPENHGKDFDELCEIESEFAELAEKRKALCARRDAWVWAAIADMAEKSAETERDYMAAMRIALAIEEKTDNTRKARKVFSHIFPTYDKKCALVNCAYIEYLDKGAKIVKFVVERKVPHDTKSLKDFARAVKSADKILIDRPLAKFLKERENFRFSLDYNLPQDQIKLATEMEIEKAKQAKAAKKSKKTA